MQYSHRSGVGQHGAGHPFVLAHALPRPTTQVRYLGKTVLLVREPDDVAAVLLRRADSFVKHPRQKRVALWLGGGLHHRVMRVTVIILTQCRTGVQIRPARYCVALWLGGGWVASQGDEASCSCRTAVWEFKELASAYGTCTQPMGGWEVGGITGVRRGWHYCTAAGPKPGLECGCCAAGGGVVPLPYRCVGVQRFSLCTVRLHSHWVQRKPWLSSLVMMP